MTALFRSPLLCATTLALALLAPAHAAQPVVNDVTQLNPVKVARILAPATVDEIVAAVKAHPGPISIGGGRYSMGGQTATEQALQIDMRQFDRVLNFSSAEKEITVQAGITWRKIQRYIDPHNLSLQIMQTYSNFTVGGSMSVNAHGRYVGQGPLVYAVKSFRLVLPDGRLARASREENPTLFYGAIGGYGALGVIVDVTLSLTDNSRVERRSQVMPIAEYRKYFLSAIAADPNVVFHNADIYPKGFDTVRATSYVKTDKAVTEAERLVPNSNSYALDRAAFWVMSEVPGGQGFRQHVIDPILFRGERVEWRNYEASYDVKELEPASRQDSTYVLQEYFIPIDQFDAFVPKMGEILHRRQVNAINVSIRHARKDPGTLLAWARNDVFAFVLYYKQGVGEADKQAVQTWTRELVDAATALGGAYYLPYQIHATDAQFRAAYPEADQFFSLKHALDPGNKFRNKLWDAYYHPDAAARLPAMPAPAITLDNGPAPAAAPGDSSPAAAVRSNAVMAGIAHYKRDEAQTYLTLPEWMLVFSPAEYAQYIKDKAPSGYPYFGAIGQFWSTYRAAASASGDKGGFNWGYHLMVSVIGASFTVENTLKGLYENTIGRLGEALRSGPPTAEDMFAARVAQEYVDFIRVEPWYKFSFSTRLKALWGETSMRGPDILRKWERKLSLSIEYAAKAQYAMLIKVASKLVYGEADSDVLALMSALPTGLNDTVPGVRLITRLDNGDTLLLLPRYEAFREAVLKLGSGSARFREIAGNQAIMVTALVPAGWRYNLSDGAVLFEQPILTDPQHKRIAIRVPVPELATVVLQLGAAGSTVEHIYDY